MSPTSASLSFLRWASSLIQFSLSPLRPPIRLSASDTLYSQFSFLDFSSASLFWASCNFLTSSAKAASTAARFSLASSRAFLAAADFSSASFSSIYLGLTIFIASWYFTMALHQDAIPKQAADVCFIFSSDISALFKIGLTEITSSSATLSFG